MNASLVAVIALVGVGAGFFGGMTYQKTRPVSASALQNLSQEQRRELMQSMFVGGNGAGGAAGGRMMFAGGQNGQGRAPAGGMGGGGLVAGEVLSKDTTSFTVKLNDGGSKIVFYSASTTVGKMDVGSIGDVTVGKNVMVNGTTNSDGSVIANSVQLRPAMPTGMDASGTRMNR